MCFEEKTIKSLKRNEQISKIHCVYPIVLTERISGVTKTKSYRNVDDNDYYDG